MAFKLFDVVAVKVDFPSYGIRAGDIGTLVEAYPDGEFEIEFSGEDGVTKSMFAVSASQISPAVLGLAA